MVAATEKSSRIAQLDGLRGIAILLVLGLHYLADSNHGPFGSFIYRFGCAFRLGWAGVDLFFILSGFLIGGILLEVRGADNYFSAFYIRRLHRIVPVDGETVRSEDDAKRVIEPLSAYHRAKIHCATQTEDFS